MNNMMDISVIDGLEPRDLASHFQRLRADGLDEVEMSNHLLNAVRTKGLRATYTMPVWLSFVQDPLGGFAVSTSVVEVTGLTVETCYTEVEGY